MMWLRWSLVWVCLLSVGTLPAQDRLGVLKEALTKSRGYSRLVVLNKISAYYLTEESEEALSFGIIALGFAQDLKNDVQAGSPDGNRQLRLIIEQEVQTNLLLGQAYATGEEKKKAIKRYRIAANLAENIGDEEGLTQAKELLEALNKGRGLSVNPGKVIQSMIETVEDLAPSSEERAGNKTSTVLAEELAANAEKNGNYRAAVGYYEDVLPDYEARGDTAKILVLYQKVGELYNLLGDDKKAQWYRGLIGYMRSPDEESDSSPPTPFQPSIPQVDHSTPPSVLEEEQEKTEAALTQAIESAEKFAAAGNASEFKRQIDRIRQLQNELNLVAQLRQADSIETANLIQNKVQEIETLRAQRELRIAQRNFALIGLLAIFIIAGLLTYLFFAKRNSHRQVTQAYQELNQTHEQLKTTQTQLVSAEKMASLGQLTAGIAHEINNPVNFISGNLRPLHSDVEDILEVISAYQERVQQAKLQGQFADIKAKEEEIDLEYVREEIRELLTGIEEGAHRTTEIVSGLRNFARLDEEEYKRYDVHQGLDSTLALLKSQLDGVEIERNYGDVPGIECYPGKLNQVFMNILNNAVQAMPQGGTIYLTTRVQKDDWVEIRLRDTGKGMAEQTLSRIFEPFFTTKDVGQGTGLGMSISHGIIRQHRGEITANSTLGEGTEIIITLPVNQIAEATDGRGSQA